MTYRSGSDSRVGRREWPQSRRSRLELAVVPAAVRIARQWTAEQLVRSRQARAGADADLVDSAVLAVSELVTNAIAAVAKDASLTAADSAGSGFFGTALAASAPATFAAARGLLPGQILTFGPHRRDAEVSVSPVTSAVMTRPLAAPPASPTPPSPASPRVWLVIDRPGRLVRLEVHDSSRDPLPPPGHSDAEDETGRGLMVVAALAKDWGWEPEPTGKVVWCELAG